MPVARRAELDAQGYRSAGVARSAEQVTAGAAARRARDEVAEPLPEQQVVAQAPVAPAQVDGKRIEFTSRVTRSAEPVTAGAAARRAGDEVAEPLPQREVAQVQVAPVYVDGKRIEFTARDEVVLRCGEASITLRRNGRIVIRGAYVESQARGTHRIKGGHVLIN